MGEEATPGLGFVNMSAVACAPVVLFRMADPTRFSDEEARRVLARAAELSVPAAQASAGDISLTDLVRIGEEAGLSREAVATAALEVSYGADGRAVRRAWAQLPYAVTRTVVDRGACSDDAWDEMVRYCRTTFAADGESFEARGLRVWQNGNLRIQLETIPGGTKLTLSTRKADAGWAAVTGISWFGAFAGLGTMLLAMGEPIGKAVALTVLALPGLGGIVWDRMRLARWAATRQAQFDALAERLPAMLRPRDRPDG